MLNCKKTIEFVVVLGFIASCTALYGYFQPQIIAGNGYGWDGLEYSKIWQMFSTGSGLNERVGFPFCNRIGTPFLASLLGIQNELLSFKLVNLTFAAIFSFSIYLIAKEAGFNHYYSVFSLLLTFIPMFSPARFTPFYPAYTDPAFLAILALAFFCLLKNRLGLSFFLIFSAYPFREAAIYVAPVFLLFAIYLDGLKRKTILLFSFAFSAIVLTKLLISHYMNCSGSQLITAIAWARSGISDPVRFLSYLSALGMTAAPLIYVRKIDHLSKLEKISAIGFLISAVLAFIGGSDVTRIFYSFLPIYFILIVSVIRARGYLFSFFCLVGYSVVNRFSSKILEPLNYIPAGDESGLFWQFPDHARPEVALMIITTWLIIFLCFDKIFTKDLSVTTPKMK